MVQGRFLGIAWNHGDAFTYRIWNTTGDDLEKGQELIRNIVRVSGTDPEEAAIEAATNFNWDMKIRDCDTEKLREISTTKASITTTQHDETEATETPTGSESPGTDLTTSTNEDRLRTVSFQDPPHAVSYTHLTLPTIA